MPIVCLGGKERNVSQIVIDCLDSSLIKINVVAGNFTQELSISIDFWISHFDASKKSALFDSLYFT